MLGKLELENFRRFGRHELPLKPTTIIVGPNNAGKSTVVEAMRLVSLVANRLGGLKYERTPAWLDAPAGIWGVQPSLRDWNTNLKTAFHDLGEPPSVIAAGFASGAEIRVFVGPDEQVFATVRDDQHRLVISKREARRATLPRLAIQPQVSPFDTNEAHRDRETVLRALDSPLASSHFRNQLHVLSHHWADFKRTAEETWPRLQVRELVPPQRDDPYFRLLLRDGRFVGEVAAMGHGLQMWLQVIWFLTRARDAPTLILDEPDVYLHADLQRKLIRLLGRRAHEQVIVATHSMEVLSEVEPDEVLVVDSTKPRSTWANTLAGVQRVVEDIGGVHVIELQRLWHARRCLFVEGDDIAVLQRIHKTQFPSAESLEVNPKLEVGGWDGWERVVGTAQFLRNAAGRRIVSYAVFDRDYHLPEEVRDRFVAADALGVHLHVWHKKELENYLLVPTAIARILQGHLGSNVPTTADVQAALDRIVEDMRDDVVDQFMSAYHAVYSKRDPREGARWARSYVETRSARDGLAAIVSGKAVLRRLRQWTTAEFGASFTDGGIARELRGDEIDEEIQTLLDAIESSKAPSPALRRKDKPARP